MMQPITLITVVIFFAVLYLRYRTRPKDAPRRSKRQQLKTVKLLLVALAVWMAVSYSLQHTIGKMDGTDQEPTLLERVVSFVSK
jgi:Na+/H+ antiporter NhaD/arsenite permease-like protein